MSAEVLTQAIGPASDGAVYKQAGRRKRNSGPVMTLMALEINKIRTGPGAAGTPLSWGFFVER